MLTGYRKWNNKMLKPEKAEKGFLKMETNDKFNECKSYKYTRINATMSIITSNVSSLNTPAERQMLSEWIEKPGPTLSSA